MLDNIPHLGCDGFRLLVEHGIIHQEIGISMSTGATYSTYLITNGAKGRKHQWFHPNYCMACGVEMQHEPPYGPLCGEATDA